MESQQIKITGGNIRNGHIYLRGIIDMFPREAIGGSNKNSIADQLLTVTYAGVKTIKTDIDGDKLFFRDRTVVKDFFKVHGIKDGDEITLSKIDKYQFKVNKA